MICLLLLDAGRFLRYRSEPKVTAVIIDSTSSMMKKERGILDLFEDITHGQVVSSFLRRFGQPDELRFHNVDNMRGAVDSSRYLDALTQTKSYLQERQDDRVVVNISLGSYSPTLQETRSHFITQICV